MHGQLDPLEKDDIGRVNGVTSSLVPMALARRPETAFDTNTEMDDFASVRQRQDGGGDEDGDEESTSIPGEVVGEKAHLLGLPMLPMSDDPLEADGDGDRDGGRQPVWWDVGNVRRGMEMVPNCIWRGMLKRAVKSCILVVKVCVYIFFHFSYSLFLFHVQVSTMTSMCPSSTSTPISTLNGGGPNLAVASVLLFAAVLDTLMDGLWVSVVLAVFHVTVVLGWCYADLGGCCW
jgi:hypothetical protein